MGCPAGASVLCLFPIPWPEAMVCIFRTTAGYLQAGDLSSGFITAHKMTRASLWSQLCSRRAGKPLPLPANPTPPASPLTHTPPNLSLAPVCSALPGDALLPPEVRLPTLLALGFIHSRDTEKSCICQLSSVVQNHPFSSFSEMLPEAESPLHHLI